MSVLPMFLVAALLACCLHHAKGADHRYRDDLPATGPKLYLLGRCERGSSSNDGCNICVCSYKGMWLCTMNACPRIPHLPERASSDTKDVPDIDGSQRSTGSTREKRSPIAIGSTTVLIRNTAECPTSDDVGKLFIHDGCKACRCMRGGLAGCSTAACEDNDEMTTTSMPEVTDAVTHDTHEEVGSTTTTPAPTTTAPASTTMGPIERVTPIPPSFFCKTYRDIGMRYFDGCNRCRCVGIEEAACTRRACPVIHRVKPIPASEACASETDIDKSYFDGCNWCQCFSVGNAVCTYRACPVIRPTEPSPEESSRDRPKSASEVCRTWEDIGTPFFDGCNRCRCSAIERAACTRKRCPFQRRSTTPSPTTTRPKRVRPIPASEVCKTADDIGKSYFNRCNWCHCMGIGEAGCTRMMCPFEKISETTSTAAPTTTPSAFCTTQEDAGRQMFDGCNHCMCTRDIRKICTMRYCFPN